MADTLEYKARRSRAGTLNNDDKTLSYNDTRELKQWLAKSNCQHYYSKFVENNITFDLVTELDSSSLREIGIDKLGDRLKLELSISNLKNEKLQSNLNIEDLYKTLNLNISNTSPISANELSGKLDLSSANDSTTLLPGAQSYLNTSSTNLNKDSNKNVTFILQDGSCKRVNVTGCFNSQSIKRKVLKKLGIKQQEAKYHTYIHSKDHQNNNQLKLNALYDVELVTICYSPDRLEKHRIILCPENETPSEIAIETSKKILVKHDRFENIRIKNQENLSQYHIPDTKPKQAPGPSMRNFFGQRPPSELISSNLAEYFPEARQKELEATVRNSVRYSVRLSRRFNLPSGIASGGSSTGSMINANPRQSIMSNNTITTTNNRASSILSNDFLNQRRYQNRTIGDVMMNNITAIDEAVNSQDNASTFSKPPSIISGMTGGGNSDDRSIHSNNSLSKANNRQRFSIATSFADQSSSNNRYSKIELFSIDSDEEEVQGDEEEGPDFISEYGTYTSGELNYHEGQELSESLDKISKLPSKKWLQGARIGAGSFGIVYLGMDPFTGELMAVKQVKIPNEASMNNELQKAMIEALEREMTLLKELNHENIVRYLGSSTDDQFLNIFLEYVPGGSVQSMLNLYGPFEEPLIRNFIRQVLIGLNYLHSEGIIHRDIKGANILIDIKGTVKISDFGISKKVGSSNVDDTEEENNQQKRGGRRASLQGSVYWMAPEVVKQTAYTKKADIWSVGCLIVEMFTGNHPFPNFSQMQAIFKIGTHILPQIPEWCTLEAKDFLQKTFEVEYENRPDAIDMLNEPFLNPLIMSKQ